MSLKSYYPTNERFRIFADLSGVIEVMPLTEKEKLLAASE